MLTVCSWYAAWHCHESWGCNWGTRRTSSSFCSIGCDRMVKNHMSGLGTSMQLFKVLTLLTVQWRCCCTSIPLTRDSVSSCSLINMATWSSRRATALQHMWNVVNYMKTVSCSNVLFWLDYCSSFLYSVLCQLSTSCSSCRVVALVLIAQSWNSHKTCFWTSGSCVGLEGQTSWSQWHLLMASSSSSFFWM